MMSTYILSCVSSMSVMLVVDLSKPEELWVTLEMFLKEVCVNSGILGCFGDYCLEK